MQHHCFIFILLLVLTACGQKPGSTIDLSGEWQFAIDPKDVGQTEEWYSDALNETVILPGSMKENNKGNEPDLRTPWTGSIYDSSFYYNPNYEKFRQEGN